MRKAAGLKRGSRKKQQNEDPNAPKESSSVNSGSTSERRKPTGDEAALTSKNYRLAKELSELRVRHRDETKNVTRLTMENMNLASRCREAISHVAMLKKELAMHQRRAADALAMQRQQTQRSSSSVSDTGVMSELSDLARPSGNNVPSSTDVAVEMDRMDRILAAHAPPPPPPQRDAVEEDGVSPQRSPVTYSSNGESLDSAKSSPSTSSTENGGEQNEADVRRTVEDMKGGEEKLSESRDNVFRSHSLFPATASPKPKHRENYNDVYPNDITPHKASHESHLPSVTDEDEEPEDAQNSPQVPLAREVANKKLSSIDAFEASFDTPFPVNFTSPKEGHSELLVTSEIYNPFFSSPAKNKANQANQDVEKEDTEKGRKWGASLRERSPVVRKSHTSRGDEAPNEGMPKMLFSGKQPSIEDVDEDRAMPDLKSPERDLKTASRQSDPSSSPMIVGRVSTSGVYSTPPQFQKISPEKPGVVVEQPRRPEKTVSASARARYEKALQPRTYTSRMKDPLLDQSSTMSVDTSPESAEVARNSPSTVLRRLQQRRQKVEQRFQATPDAGTSVPSIRHSARSLRHPPVPTVDSPFDEDVGVGRINGGQGRNLTNQNGSMSYRTSQNDAENSYQWTGSLSNPASTKLSPDSMNAEFRALDAMASGSYQRGDESPSGSDSSARYSALKQRRSVKQPVSYAEPPLNTKVRRGDVYFPRAEDEDNSTTPVVSPTGSSDDSGRKARTRSGASPDEVLKDLAGPTTVRS